MSEAQLQNQREPLFKPEELRLVEDEIAKRSFKINEGKRALDKCIAKQDFVQEKILKSCIEECQNEKDMLEEYLKKGDETKMDNLATDMDTGLLMEWRPYGNGYPDWVGDWIPVGKPVEMIDDEIKVPGDTGFVSNDVPSSEEAKRARKDNECDSDASAITGKQSEEINEDDKEISTLALEPGASLEAAMDLPLS